MLILTGALARTNAFYGRGSGLIMVTNVGCTGEEQSLLNCTHTGYGVTSCGHYEDAGVRCPGKWCCLSKCTIFFACLQISNIELLRKVHNLGSKLNISLWKDRDFSFKT